MLTEYSPDVPWAGKDNTIPCAAAHHLADAQWLRSPDVADSYSRWWLSGLQGVRHNYYFWLFTALRRRLAVEGVAGLALVRELLPNATALYAAFANGTYPPGSQYLAAAGCMYNVDGNEGQERTISG